MSNTANKEYRTSDLHYAAYLKVAGCFLKGLSRDGNRFYFVFERPERLSDLKQQYYNRTGKVPALTYADEVRSLKAMIHSAKEK